MRLFGTKPSPVQELNRGTILKSKSGMTTVKVVGFGFLGHSCEVIDRHPMAACAIGEKVWTGQEWSQLWEVA